MIRSILLTSIISFASTGGALIKKSAPLKSNVAETKQELRAENPTYEQTWSYEFVQKVNQPWKHDYNDISTWDVDTGQAYLNEYKFNQKNYNFSRNNAWSIYSTMYTQNNILAYKYMASGNVYGGLKIKWRRYRNNELQHQFDEQTNNNLFIFKLEPHNQAVSTNFTLNTVITSKLDIFKWYWETPHEIGDIILDYRITILTTKNTIVEQYNNATITEASNFKNWYLNIVNNADDITSETIYRHVKLGEVSSNNQLTSYDTQNLQLTTNLSSLGLLTNETNYAVVLIERGIGMYEHDTNNLINFNGDLQIKDLWGSADGNRYNYYWMHDTQTTISGTYILNTNVEVIDMPSLMFTILGMPFTFYSSAFNFTMFAGTPYAINISNIILTILASLIFIFIVRLILKVFS